jgi:acyl dehydratase
VTVAPLHTEDLTVGHRFRTGGVTVTEAHVVGFAGLSGDVNPLHMDAVWAEREGPYGARIAHGMLVLSIVSGLRCLLDDLALVGFLGIEDWRFRGPVFLGDTVCAEMTLVELRPTSRPGRSVLRVEVEVLNQRDECVQRGHWAMMILDREAGS